MVSFGSNVKKVPASEIRTKVLVVRTKEQDTEDEELQESEDSEEEEKDDY